VFLLKCVCWQLTASSKANILIDDDEKAQLADLGISSVAVSGSETLGWATATAGGVRGSLRWMSPEAILDSGPCKTTARDVYAFGSTILEVSLVFNDLHVLNCS
jgi:serine/threonine protein kinase